jgi:hypothetical protein
LLVVMICPFSFPTLADVLIVARGSPGVSIR